MKMRLMFASAVAALAVAAPAAFQPADAREQLTDAEMDDARGGILVAGNVAFEFGAVMKTYEDGVLALQTQVTWTPEGQQITQTLGPDVFSINSPQGMELANAANIALNAALKNGQSAFVTGTGTALVQNIADNQVLNAVLNTSSNHDFHTDTSLVLTLPGFASNQLSMSQSLSAMHMVDELNQVMNAVGR